MVKLPWSKTKKNAYPYTPHSAPITNGILRNGKGATASTSLSERSGSRHSDDAPRVRFSLRRTDTQMDLESINTAMDRREVERTRAISPDGHKKKTRGEEGEGRRRTKNTDRKKSQRNSERQGGDRQRGRKSKSTSSDEWKSSSIRSLDSDANKSEGSSDTITSLEKPKRRLGDLPADKLASSYGRWESDETLDTAEVSDVSDHGRPPARDRLSVLLDQKMEAKAALESEGKEREGMPRQRSKLSLLLDEKIEAKMRREAERLG